MFNGLDLNLVWFLLIGVLLTGYAILDGFDLGVGILHLFTRQDEHRRLFLNTIGPVWDGNEVWLVTGGGALFAAFPDVYATVFSGFYMAFMLLLVALIFRAVAIEFRSKEPMAWWRQLWDVSFSASSLLGALLMGVALGNIAMGIPLGIDKEYAGTFWQLLNPYAVLVGLLTVSLFAAHANLYLVLKLDGELQQKVRGWVKDTSAIFVVLYGFTTVCTLLYLPHMTHRIQAEPLFFVVALVNMLSIANMVRDSYYQRDGRAFLSSCVNIVSLMALFGLGIFPNLVLSAPYPEFSLTLYNASSSQATLGTMLWIAILGVPIVLSYTAAIYWVFRGKVSLDKHSY